MSLVATQSYVLSNPTLASLWFLCSCCLAEIKPDCLRARKFTEALSMLRNRQKKTPFTCTMDENINSESAFGTAIATWGKKYQDFSILVPLACSELYCFLIKDTTLVQVNIAHLFLRDTPSCNWLSCMVAKDTVARQQQEHLLSLSPFWSSACSSVVFEFVFFFQFLSILLTVCRCFVLIWPWGEHASYLQCDPITSSSPSYPDYSGNRKAVSSPIQLQSRCWLQTFVLRVSQLTHNYYCSEKETGLTAFIAWIQIITRTLQSM